MNLILVRGLGSLAEICWLTAPACVEYIAAPLSYQLRLCVDVIAAPTQRLSPGRANGTVVSHCGEVLKNVKPYSHRGALDNLIADP